MNGGGAGLLEQDACRRGGGGTGACRAPAATGFFLFFGKHLVPVVITNPGLKGGPFVSHH
jgi:hypothetical protein